MKYLVYILLLLLPMAGNSQEDKNLFFQFNLGTTIALPNQKIIKDNSSGVEPFEMRFSPGLGYSLEYLTEYTFNHSMSINAGINYTYNRLNEDTEVWVHNYKGTLTRTYLQLPIFLRYKVLNNHAFAVSVGSYFAYLKSASREGIQRDDTTGFNLTQVQRITTYYEHREYDQNLREEHAEFDVGILTQIDYEIKIAKSIALVIYGRFNIGLEDIQHKDFSTQFRPWKNMGLIIGTGIKI